MRVSNQDANQALGIFFQSFEGARAIMTQRAQRLAWEESQPKIQAELEKLYEPLKQADEEASKATTPEEKAAAIGRRMQATRDFGMKSMEMAARLSASGNPHAAQYAKTLQDSVSQALTLEMQGAQMGLQADAQQWERTSKERAAAADEAHWNTQQGQRAEDKATEDQRWAQQQGWRREDQAAERANQMRDDARADKGLALEERRVSAEESRSGKEADPLKRAGQVAELLAQRDALKTNGVAESMLAPIDQALEQFGVKKDTTVELFSGDLEKRRNQVMKLRELAKDAATKKLYDEELADIEAESARLVDEDAKMRRKSRDPGFLQSLLDTFETPPGGSPGGMFQVK